MGGFLFIFVKNIKKFKFFFRFAMPNVVLVVIGGGYELIIKTTYGRGSIYVSSLGSEYIYN